MNKKKKIKNSVSPLLWGVSGIVGFIFATAVGIFAVGSLFFKDGQSRLLAVGDTPVPYLEAAEIAAESHDYFLAEELVRKSKVLGITSNQESSIWPENAIKKNIEETENQLKEAPSAYLYLKLAYDNYTIKNFESAKKAIENAVKIAPNDGEVKTFLLWSQGW